MARKTKPETAPSQKSSKTKHQRQTKAIWHNIDLVMRNITKIQRSICKNGEPVSQLELHELKRLGRKYASLIKRLPAEYDD